MSTYFDTGVLVKSYVLENDSPLAVGLIFSGATLIAQAAQFGWAAWVLVAVTVVANLRTKLHPLWFIAGGAALGLLGLV